MAGDVLQAGIDALQRGDRQQARMLLEQAVAADDRNEMAWYYLAAAQDDPAMRRTYLERVLIINPNNTRARDVLQKMDEAEQSSGNAQPAASQPPPRPEAPRGKVKPLVQPTAGDTPGADDTGFALPATIPGAPEKVGFAALFRDGLALFLAGVDALRQKPGVYETELGKASWWRFWLLFGWCAVASAVLIAVGSILGSVVGIVLGRGFPIVGILFAIIVMIISVPFTLVSEYAGVWLSGWYAREQQRSAVPLYQHAYAIAIYWGPAAVLGAALQAVTGVLGLGFIGALGSLALNILALYMIALGFRALHRFATEYQEYITVVIFWVAAAVVAAVLGIFIGVFTVAGAATAIR